MAKVTKKEAIVLDKKALVRAGKDLNTILAADDDGNPAIPVKGTEDEIKAKLIEAIQFVTPEDKLKKPTRDVLEALKAEQAEEPEKEEVPDPTPRPTAAQIGKMNKKDLEQLCDDLELETDPDDYEKVKDLKAAMIAEMFSETDPVDIGETGNEKATDPEPETVPPVEKKKKDKKTVEKKAGRKESMQALADRLLKSGASEKDQVKEFLAAYKEKGKTDLDFIKKRISIYMNITAKK